MTKIESLNKLRSSCTAKVSFQLANGASIRNLFHSQLERFFELLINAVDAGDENLLVPVLDAWVETRTQTELQNREAPLSAILDNILQAIYEVSREQLADMEAIDLLGALMPIFTRARHYINAKETDLLIDHISDELNNTRLNLERLDKMKSDFISIAAHELKTPLTLIEGYSAMLQEGMNELQTGDFALLLNGINNGSQRLKQFVDDMIDVSIIDADLLALTFQPVWINRLLEMLGHEFKRAMDERMQILIVQEFPGIERMIYADEERLYQALRNILINAIKYTPDGGFIKIDGRTLPGFTEITIQDTGIGVNPDDHYRIFEKFGRLGDVSLHSSGKTKFMGGGPGLGLPIAKGIVEAHGGAIWVESEGYDEQKCPGTTFHVLIPAREESPDQRIAQFFNVSTVIPSETNIAQEPNTAKI